MTTPRPPAAAAPPILMPELLGFSPQLLLDDIIEGANDSIVQVVNGMEPFLQRWADGRTETAGADWDPHGCVEQGIFQFQTLLESHTDIAFDFFEAWSLRNIFALPPDLAIVAPHHRGVDLSPRAEEEAELLAEIEGLRRRLDNQRRLKRMYTQALRIARAGHARSQRRARRLDYLAGPAAELLAALPAQALELYESVSALPHVDPTTTDVPVVPDPSKNLWETNKTGYVSWAVGQLVSRVKEEGPSSGNTIVGNAVEKAHAVGEAEDIKDVLREVEGKVEPREDKMDLSET